MSSVNHPNYVQNDVRLIDEQRFIQALMDAVLRKRKKPSTVPTSCRKDLTDSGIVMTQPKQKVMVQP